MLLRSAPRLWVALVIVPVLFFDLHVVEKPEQEET
jgi:hypothetical protein